MAEAKYLYLIIISTTLLSDQPILTLSKAEVEEELQYDRPSGLYVIFANAITMRNLNRLADLIASYGVEINDIHDGNGNTPLLLAADQNEPDMIEQLIVAGADMNRATTDARHEAPLHRAARLGNLAAVNKLLELGPTYGLDLNQLNGAHQTPLDIADAGAVPALIAANAHYYNEL
ncbi:MAG TPA: ankyrin repeat domain-containing protein [Candidatus Babeliales bacterium]|nr:ankyrin repeat domain-containing protein [Candidatus Babeliales bacterium]